MKNVRNVTALGKAFGAMALLALLGAAPLRVLAQGEGSQAPSFRPVFCTHGFSPAAYQTFSLEPLKTKSEKNGLDDATLVRVRRSVIDALIARGYRYDDSEAKDGDHGRLLVSYGFFPAIDLSHPTVGVFIKLRCGTGTFDLTKWSTGAMIDQPYTAETLVPLAGAVASQVPARDGVPTAEPSTHQGS